MSKLALPPHVEAIVEQAARRFQVFPEDITAGQGQDAVITQARAYAAWRLSLLGYSTPHIGRLLNRHHSSILYLLKKFPEPDFDTSKPDESGVWAI